MSYNTKQKNMVLDVIKKQKGEFTVKDIYDALNGSIGLTTVYRMVDRLAKENYLSKNIGKDNSTYYLYLEKCNNENHFFLKCDSCGNMEHVDCDCIGELNEHILKEHNFAINHDHIIINGICKKCGGKK